MLKLSDLIAVSGATALLTLGLAAAQARDLRAPKPADPVAAAAVAPTIEQKAEAGQAAAEQIVQTSACGRKIKVVYTGYGEGDRACINR